MEPRRRTVSLGWGTVSYLEWLPSEQSSGSELLLLHGGGVDCAELSWGGLGPILAAAGHRVIAPDHPGYGETPLPPWRVTQSRLVEYVGELIEALDLHEYVVGGLSLGGGMSIGHLLARPSVPRGAILLGSYGLMAHQFEGPFKRPLHLLTWAVAVLDTH